MKYNVSCVVNDREYEVQVSCRWDAKTKTLFRKCMTELYFALYRDGIKPVGYSMEMPNIWTNGAIGAVWFVEPFANVSIIREDGCCIAL